MVKTLFFLEDPDGIEQLNRDSAGFSGPQVFISLSPRASYAFERAQIPYRSIRDYGGGEERVQEGLKNFQRFDRIATILDTDLAPLHHIQGLTPARYAFYQFKILFDVLWNTILVLRQIVNMESPDEIYLYANPRDEATSRPYVFSDHESVYADVLRMRGWSLPVKIHQNTVPPKENRCISSSCSSTWLKNLILQQDLLFNLGLMAKRGGIGMAAVALFSHITSRQRTPVLIYNSGYNWDDTLREFYKERIVPVHRIHDEYIPVDLLQEKAVHDRIVTLCRTHPGMREFDRIRGIDVSDLFFDRVSEIAARAHTESVAAYTHTREKINHNKIRCLLLSTRDHARGHAIVHAAHEADIPVISWQHGGAGYHFHPVMPFIEFINSDFHFVFGAGVASSYSLTSKSMGLANVPTFIPVGSSSLDIFFRNGKKTAAAQNKRVVFVTTAYSNNTYMNSGKDDIPEFNENLWEVQQRFLRLAKKYTDIKFVIKLHPSHCNKEPLQSFVNDHEIQNIDLVTTEKSLRELTDIADLMIFDLISTGILQVLTTEVPVFIYPGLYNADPEPISHLRKRAYVCEEKEQLFSLVQEFLGSGSVQGYENVDRKNTDFLKLYGTDPLTHGSARQAIHTLKEILRKSKYG